jgi:hypothetical protein
MTRAGRKRLSQPTRIQGMKAVLLAMVSVVLDGTVCNLSK